MRPPSQDALEADVDRGAAGLTRWLHALKTRASFMMITAHPDDEDGGMLAMETRGMGARGVLLTLNRGEGGQNAMSPDNYDALGLVRTQELPRRRPLLWRRPILDARHRLRLFEDARGGTSRNGITIRVLSDVVRVIRMTRPLVITSVFVGAATDGHGNHQVAGQMAQEAFLAAGDPKRFPSRSRKGCGRGPH